MRILLAGGGTAGHTSPLLATADALRRADPSVEITCLGTPRGLENRVVPEAGYPLELIPPVPLPRKPSLDLVRVPGRLRGAVRATLEVLDRVRPDAVVGYGGYVSMPAYLAARRRRIPLVVHEQNALPGLANKAGARVATRVAVSFPGTKLPKAEYVGLPIRRMISQLDRLGSRAEAREFFGLEPDLPTLVVTGGSQGARRLNEAVSGAATALGEAGVQVLHVVGPQGSATPTSTGTPYVVEHFVDRMDLALAAADLMICRAGASSVTEAAAVGVPAVFVPLPIGNGEQDHNARPVVDAGGALLVSDAALTSDWVASTVPALLNDPERLARMGAAAAGLIPRDADEKLARIVAEVAEGAGRLMKVPVPDEVLAAEQLGHVHFVGIGGAGLSGMARIMLARDIEVSGSDGADSPTLETLRALGAVVHVGHHAAHVAGADTVVVSTAVREDNPEYVAAVRAGLRVWPRSAALASLMSGRRTVAVAGTHGKTTTTSLLTVALQAAGAEPTYAIGGDLSATGVNAGEGSGDLFVAEADESDGAFLVYRPFAAIVTSVAADHLDHWKTAEAYVAAFEEFADGIPDDGFLVCCVDDPGAAVLADRRRAAGARVITVSTRPGVAEVGPERLAGVSLWSPGDHYLADALAALAAGLELGFAEEALVQGIATYTGTRRRMEPKGEVGGIRVYDSYAHHPTEIAGDLQSARLLAGRGRLLVAFQPHLVSRTRLFGAAMGEALGAADEVVVCEVYLAREDPDPEVTAALVAGAVPLPSAQVSFVSDLGAVAAELVARARPGDLVLTLGAGDVTTVGPQVLDLLRDRERTSG